MPSSSRQMTRRNATFLVLVLLALCACGAHNNAPLPTDHSGSPQAAKKALVLRPLKGAGDKYGYIDASGTFVIRPQFQDAQGFREGMAAVAVGSAENRRWGYITPDGKFAMNPQFEDAEDFSDGRAAVKIAGAWGFIDRDGRVVVTPEYTSVGRFSDGVAPVEVADGWGVIDKEGNYVVHPTFGYVYGSADGLMAVIVGGQYGYIDTKGKFVINPQFAGSTGPRDLLPHCSSARVAVPALIHRAVADGLNFP